MSNDLSSWLTEVTASSGSDVDISSAKKEHKLDLFNEVLPALDRRDKFFYRRLSDELKKEISPWVLMRWVSSIERDPDLPLYILSVNDFVNNNFSVFGPSRAQGNAGHVELQWMLLSLCGTGKTVRRKFVKPPKGAVKNRLEEEILKFYPNLNNSELELFFKMNSKESIKEFFEQNGYDDKAIKEIFK